MSYQQKSVQQKLSHPDMNEDGFTVLNEEVLELIIGGKGAMAQDQIVEAEIATFESNHTSPAVVNIFQNTNTGVSNAKNGNLNKH